MMTRLSFGGVYCFTARCLKEWEKAILMGDQDCTDYYRREYLLLLNSMGWTEEEYDYFFAKMIELEWIKLCNYHLSKWRRANFRVITTSNLLH